jgi:hypothetical protein
MARRFRGNHDDINIGSGHNLPIVHVKTVGEGQRSAGFDIGIHFVTINLTDVFIGQQHHDHVSLLNGIGHFSHF